MIKQGMLGLELTAAPGASDLSWEVYTSMSREAFSEANALTRKEIFHEVYDEVRMVIADSLIEKWFSMNQPPKLPKHRKRRC